MTQLHFSELEIVNPKQYAGITASDIKTQKVFPYYAGYSSDFAARVLKSVQMPAGSLVVDPWNGGGTTTRAAFELGHQVIGYDLNPAMVIVAKAAILSVDEQPSLLPLAQSVAERVRSSIDVVSASDPLCTWLSPSSAAVVRKLESEINRSLVRFESYEELHSADALSRVSSLAAFFYVVLFRTVRRLLIDFIPTNPTWTKKPELPSQRKRPSEATIINTFLNEVGAASFGFSSCASNHEHEGALASIRLGNSQQLDLDDRSANAVISSPPYCTRIDYAVATAIELAVLRFNVDSFDALRRSLMGTSTVATSVRDPERTWGPTCLNFLDRVHSHPSKASKTYYYKNHIQYFTALKGSIREISRVLTKDGICVLVIQDSYYKEILNDVPTIAAEMAEFHGLELIRRDDFPVHRSMVGINRKAKGYLDKRRNVESVLCFRLM